MSVAGIIPYQNAPLEYRRLLAGCQFRLITTFTHMMSAHRAFFGFTGKKSTTKEARAVYENSVFQRQTMAGNCSLGDGSSVS